MRINLCSLPIYLQFIILLLLISVIFSCQTNEFARNDVFSEIPQDFPLLVQLALGHLPNISSNDSKFFVIDNIIQLLIEKELLAEATILLNNSMRFVESNFTGSRKIEAIITLARSYVDLGSVEQGVALLDQALRDTYETENNKRQEILVQEIISACFFFGDEAISVLQQAVRNIYAVRDYNLRVNLLLDAARLYQESGEGQKANILLQQAIPAASSINDSFIQAHAYSHLGLRFNADKEDAFAETYSKKAIEILEERQSEYDSREYEFLLLETLVNLARSGYGNEILIFTTSISVLRSQIDLLLEISGDFLIREQTLQADLAFNRLFSLVENAMDPELIVSTLINVSQLYIEANQDTSAGIYIDSTANYLTEISDPFQADRLLLEIALQYAKVGNYQKAVENAEKISDVTYAFLAYQRIVSQRLDLANPNIPFPEEVIRESLDLLHIALSVEPVSSLAINEQVGEVAVIYARLGEIERSMELISQMKNPFSKALSIASVYGVLDQDENTIVQQYQNRLRL